MAGGCCRSGFIDVRGQVSIFRGCLTLCSRGCRAILGERTGVGIAVAFDGRRRRGDCPFGGGEVLVGDCRVGCLGRRGLPRRVVVAGHTIGRGRSCYRGRGFCFCRPPQRLIGGDGVGGGFDGRRRFAAEVSGGLVAGG